VAKPSWFDLGNLHWYKHRGCLSRIDNGRDEGCEIEVCAVDGLDRFASNPEQTLRLWSELESLVDPSVDLPQSPFRRHDGAYAFCSFDWVFSPEFDGLLVRLAEQSGDEDVRIVDIHNPSMFVLHNGLSYGALSFPIRDIEASLRPAVAEWQRNGAPPFEIVSLRPVLFGSSKQWSIWADRGWDIAIIQTGSRDRGWQVGIDFLVDASYAYDHFIEFSRLPQFRTKQLRESFFRNFT
jgi:hypothetical protein